MNKGKKICLEIIAAFIYTAVIMLISYLFRLDNIWAGSMLISAGIGYYYITAFENFIMKVSNEN